MTPETPYVMPFGKHRGVALADLPGDYVGWLHTKLSEWRPPLRDAIIAEVKRRDAAPPVATVPVVIDVDALITAGVRHLSQRHAGDDAAMKQIKDTETRLRRLTGRMGWSDDDSVPF